MLLVERKRQILLPGLASAVVLVQAGCAGGGHAEYHLGTHTVNMEGCSSNSLQAGGSSSSSINGKTVAASSSGSVIGCGDTYIVVSEDSLTVNNKPYGKLNPNDTVLVKDGTVSVNGTERKADQK